MNHTYEGFSKIDDLEKFTEDMEVLQQDYQDNIFYNSQMLNKSNDGCYLNYNNELQKVFENNKSYQLKGYTKNDYYYKMEMMNSKIPLPVNANFFLGKY